MINAVEVGNKSNGKIIDSIYKVDFGLNLLLISKVHGILKEVVEMQFMNVVII